MKLPTIDSTEPNKPALLIGGLGLFASAAAAIAAGVSGFSFLPSAPENTVWAAAYALLIIGTLYLYFRGSSLLLTRIVYFGLAALGVAALVFSENGPDLLAWAWLALLSAGMGSWALRRLNLVRPERLGERLLIGLALGIGALALLTYGLGSANVYADALGLPVRYFKWLHPIPVFASLGFLSVLVLPWLYRDVRAWRRSPASANSVWNPSRSPTAALFLAAFALCFVALFVWALSPSIRFDSLVYHLAAPQKYVDYRGILEISEPMHFYMSHYAEMIFTLALVVADQPLPSLMHLLAGLVSAGLTYLIAWRMGYPKIGWAAALLYFSLPIFYDAGTAHNDFFVAMFTLGSFYAILAWWQERRINWLVVGGVLAGLSVGTKINSAMPALVGGLAILIGLIYSKTSWKKSIAALAGYALPLMLIYVPWGVLKGVWTGNPLYPFFCQFFSCPAVGISISSPMSAEMIAPRLLANFVLLPWNVTVMGAEYYIENFGGAVGGVFLFSLPWFLLFRGADPRMRKTALWLSVFTVANFLFLFPFAHRVRYVLPIIPVLCILTAINGAMLYQAVAGSPKRKIFLIGSIIVLACYFYATRLVVTSSGWQLPDRYPYKVALGLESSASYLSRTLPAYDALQYLNGQGNGNFKVASFGDETRIYTTADVHTLYYSNEITRVLAAPSTEEIARLLKQMNYSYLLINPKDYALNIQYDARISDSQFLDTYARLVFARDGVFLYRLFPDEIKAVPAPGDNLLANASFEQDQEPDPTAGWGVYGEPSIDRSGSSAKVGSAAVLASDLGYVYQRVAVAADHLYTTGHWSRGGNGAEQIRLQVLWLDRNEVPLTTTIESLPVKPEWTWNQFSYSAPEGAVYAQIYVTTGDDGQAWFDNICFVEGPTCAEAGE